MRKTDLDKAITKCRICKHRFQRTEGTTNDIYSFKYNGQAFNVIEVCVVTGERIYSFNPVVDCSHFEES